MKKIFLLIVTFCLLQTAYVPLRAQGNQDALIAAIDTIVRKYSHEKAHEDIIEEAIKNYKKDAKMMARVARCYYNYYWEDDGNSRRQMWITHEPEKAYKFVYRALQIDTACVDAYLLAADIEQREMRVDSAVIWLEKGLAQSPNSIELKDAYSVLKATEGGGLEEAIAYIQEEAAKDPNIDANLKIARLHEQMYNTTGQPNYLVQAGPYYLKCNLNDLTTQDFQNFLIGLDVAQLWDNLRTASSFSNKKYPGRYLFARYYFISLVNLKEWEEALSTYEQMKTGIGYKLDARDEAYLGNVYRGLKRYDEAMNQYEKVLAMDDKSGNGIANNGIKGLMDEQLNEFIQADRYDEAASFYKKFIDRRKAEGKLDGPIYSNYAKIFMLKSNKLEGAEKAEALRKAASVFKEWIANEDYNNNIAVAHGQLMTISQLLYSVEQNMDVIYEAAHDMELFYDGLPEDEQSSTTITKYYLNALDLIIRYYFQTGSAKPQERERLKAYGDKILDMETDPTRLQRVMDMYNAWKIK